jgi:hypothetical protein
MSRSTLAKLLDRSADRATIAEALNHLSGPERLETALALRGKQVAALYAACAGGAEVQPTDFVPAETADDVTVIFEGRNSLPVASRFQKRFARLDDEIVGYNHQALAPLTGPGFFVIQAAHAGSDVPEELYFDYTAAPRSVPSGWPAFKPNTAGLSNLVYKGMKDYMRAVAQNVVVGKAYKFGRSQDAYFLLAHA